MNDTVTITVNIKREYMEQVTRRAACNGITRTQEINDALVLKEFIQNIIREGGKLLVQRAGETTLRHITFY